MAVKRCVPGKKCVDVYLGGETEVGNHVPRQFDKFFDKRLLLMTLMILVLGLILAEVHL